MKHVVSMLALSLASLFAAAQQPTSFDVMASKFGSGVYPTRHVNLPYRIAGFNPTAEGKTSLIVLLHSSSYSGENNVSQLRMGVVRNTVKYVEKKGMKAVILVPQCRKDRWWNESYATNGEAMPAILKGCIDHIVQNERIDGDIYVLGVSTGAAGAWSIADEYPGLCSAILVAGSYPGRISATKVRKTPQCVIVAEGDKVASTEKVSPFVEKLRKNGDVRYVIATGNGIYDVPENGFTDDNLDWVFSHHRR